MQNEVSACQFHVAGPLPPHYSHIRPQADQVVRRGKSNAIVPMNGDILHQTNKIHVRVTSAKQTEAIDANREAAKIMPLVELPVFEPHE